MTTFDPPLETGFTGDRYLSEDIEHVGLTPTTAHDPGVYILRCSKPKTRSLEAITRRWLATADTEHVPPYLDDVADASALAYVGASGTDVYDRIGDHTDGEHRQVGFLKAFPPHRLERVTLTETPFEDESSLATELQNERPSFYIHSR